MKLIPLSQEKFAQVDDGMFDFLSQWKWHYDGQYARRNITVGKKQKHILMHRAILESPKGTLVDHRNGDTLDNQVKNLRLSNHSTNAMNMRKHRGSSQYKGVSNHEGLWRTQIWQDNKRVFANVFSNERWAAMAYDLNATALFGEYARLNFPKAILVCQE